MEQLRRFFRDPQGSFFLFGPRGTGKSTWLRFVLTGSSARKLRRGNWNLLAGRLTETSMHPFMAAELGAFARFLEAISFSHGSLLNLAEVARECQVGRKTVEGYLDILEDLLLSFRVPVFTRRAKRHLVAHDKFFYFDTGVYRSLRPAGPLDRPGEIEGMALEGLVAQHLRAFREDYPEASACLLYMGKERLAMDGIPCIPCEEFLGNLHPDRAELP